MHPAEEKESSVKLPDKIEAEIEEMKKKFSTFRPSRSLNIKKQVGMVTLQIEIGEQVHDLEVTPVQARNQNSIKVEFSL